LIQDYNKIEVRPRNWLVPVILLTLKEWDSYGYKLMEQARAFGFGAMNPGTLYRTLRHMEKEGLCQSEWDTTEGRGPAQASGTAGFSTKVRGGFRDRYAPQEWPILCIYNTHYALYSGPKLKTILGGWGLGAV
jgi:PadR family transcriptional regulator, regulatory protein PadR